MANEWEISRATGRCVTTGRELAEGEFYYTALFETAEGFERKDYSMEGWSGPPEGTFCHWKTRMPVRGKKAASIAVDNSLLVNLFCRLEEDSSEMRQNFRFVLALLLMRKRLLRLDRTTHQDEREYWQMRLTGEQSLHQVLNPNLTTAEIERLSAQLTAILSGDALAISSLEEEAEAPATDAPALDAAPADEPVLSDESAASDASAMSDDGTSLDDAAPLDDV